LCSAGVSPFVIFYEQANAHRMCHSLCPSQVLDYVTGVLMGAKGFLPNLHAGTAAACLTRLLTKPKPLSEFEWSQAQQLAHTLRAGCRNAASSLSNGLLHGKANPADTISKYVLAALRVAKDPAAADGSVPEQQQQQVLRLVLEEWLAAMMQRHYGKSTPETDAAYSRSLLQYLPVEALFGPAAAAAMDPLQQLHPLEAVKLAGLQRQGGSEQQQARGQFQSGWEQAVLGRLAGTCADVPAHPVLAPFLQRAGRLLALLLPADCDVTAAAAGAINSSNTPGVDGSVDTQQGPAAAVAWCWEGWQKGLVELLLLRQRTARYSHSVSAGSEAEGEATSVTWQAADRASVGELAVQRLKHALAEQLAGYRQARAAEAKRQLVAAAAAQLLLHADSASAASAALEKLGHMQLKPVGAAVATSTADAEQSDGKPQTAVAGVKGPGPAASLLGMTVSLQRIDVPAILEQLKTQSNPGAAGAAASSGSKSPDHGPPPSKSQRTHVTSTPHGTTSAGSSDWATHGVLHALVLGGWCHQPAQVLRRRAPLQQLCHDLGQPGEELVAAIIAQNLCKRDSSSCNGRGHTAELPYPGPSSWTPEYAAARNEAIGGAKHVSDSKKRKVARYVAQMQRFTAVAAWARDVAGAAGDDGKQRADVEGVLAGVTDANKLGVVTAKLEKVLGMRVPANVATV
jgi:hypothetical protein